METKTLFIVILYSVAFASFIWVVIFSFTNRRRKSEAETYSKAEKAHTTSPSPTTSINFGTMRLGDVVEVNLSKIRPLTKSIQEQVEKRKVYIFQTGNIPPNRIIEELESRGGKNSLPVGCSVVACCYFIRKGTITFCNSTDELEHRGLRRLYYDPETDAFYEVDLSKIRPNTFVRDRENVTFEELRDYYRDCQNKLAYLYEAAKNRELTPREHEIESQLFREFNITKALMDYIIMKKQEDNGRTR